MHEEEKRLAPAQIDQFGQEEDYLLLHGERARRTDKRCSDTGRQPELIHCFRRPQGGAKDQPPPAILIDLSRSLTMTL